MALKHSLIGASIGLVAALAGCDEQGIVVSNKFCPEFQNVYMQPAIVTDGKRYAIGKLPVLETVTAANQIKAHSPRKGEVEFFVDPEDAPLYVNGKMCTFDPDKMNKQRIIILRRLERDEFERQAWNEYSVAKRAGYNSSMKGSQNGN